MKKISLILFVLLISLLSCKKKETEEEIILEKNKVIESNIENEETKRYNVERIYNDTISANLKSSLENLSNDKSKFRIDIRPTKNRENSLVIDTLKTLTFDKTEIVIYKTEKWSEVISAEIKNSEVVLVDKIKIGMNISDFRNIINLKPETDLILIMDREHRIGFRFIFDNGKLNLIDYEGSYR